MSMLVNIRGTNGSGKSTLMRKFIGSNPKLETFTINDRDVKVLNCGGRYVLGDYTRDCGGLDTLKNLDEIRGMVREYIAKGDVFMEGMMYSTLYTSSAAIDDEISAMGHKYYWVQIDVPVQTCIDSTMERRIRNENFKEFDPIQLARKWRSIGSAFNKAVDAKRLTYIGNRQGCEDAINQALDHNDDCFNLGVSMHNEIDYSKYPPIQVTNDMIDKYFPKADNNLFSFML
jgi:hypothetical protein